MTHENDPAAALRAVRNTQKRAAGRVRAPAYYHPAIGFIFFMQFAAIELGSGGTILTILSLMLLAVLVTQYRRRTGTWQNGFTAGGRRTRRLMWGGIAAIILALLVGTYLKLHLHIDGAMLAAGALSGIFATWLGYAWERSFLAEAGTEQ